MYKKEDFKKLDLLGSGKKHTKIYKVQHVGNGKIFALKEIEAKNLEKLNEYKEEAVQLSKVQNHPNIVKFYGYYFCETMYNSFRLGLVTEYMEQSLNLENQYRKRKKLNQHWKESELVTFTFSLISTCSFLQQRGICHRDIKPANLFILPNSEAKIIDFGESKDYFFDMDDDSKNTYTMATIRGTPQYLSPILWKAHVIDGNSRYVQHNIYKSDVFSSGLVIFQMAALQEVTGFNNMTPEINGEDLIKQNLQELEKMYSPQFVSIIALMLIFDESARPSYHQIEQIFYDLELNESMTNESPGVKGSKGQDSLNKSTIVNEYIKYYNRNYSTITTKPLNTRASENAETLPNYTSKSLKTSIKTTLPGNQRLAQSVTGDDRILQAKNNGSRQSQQGSNFSTPVPKESEQQQQQRGQIALQSQQLGVPTKQPNNTELKDARSVYWFEFGGKAIGKFSVVKKKWRIFTSKDENDFPMHFSSVYIPPQKCYYLLGGPLDDSFRIFKNENEPIARGKPSPRPKNFCSILYNQNKLYIFGGYDDIQKKQCRSCELYDIIKGEWSLLPDMNQERSQATACFLDSTSIYVFGGYNRNKGTLQSIERYNLLENRFDLLDITLKEPLRRAGCVAAAPGEILIMGGIKRNSKASQSVYKFSVRKSEIQEWENLTKGGVIEYDVLADAEGYLHIFLEDAFGTSPPTHVLYAFDAKMTKYVTTNVD